MTLPGQPSGRAELGRRAATASEAHVAQAARDALERGNAVDAVVAGVLVAAAETPSVFLGPVQVVAGGAGAGLVAIDGRVRQPGRGVGRPRGFLADEPIPLAARVGVPTLPSALATAVATLGATTLLRLAGPAIARGGSHSRERAALLEAFARRGAQVLTEEALVSDLTVAAGRAARGLLTLEDLASVRPNVIRFDDRRLEPSGILTVPWRAVGGHEGTHTQVVVAADSRGMVAAACYETPVEGLPIGPLGVVAPMMAAPVMRGQPRVVPGEARPAAAPIALRVRRGVLDVAVGVAASPDAEGSLQRIADALDEMPTVSEALSLPFEGKAVALVRTSDHARVVRGS